MTCGAGIGVFLMLEVCHAAQFLLMQCSKETVERNCGSSDGAQLMCKSHQLLIGQDLGQHDC
jgi:hypothetical protein